MASVALSDVFVEQLDNPTFNLFFEDTVKAGLCNALTLERNAVKRAKSWIYLWREIQRLRCDAAVWLASRAGAAERRRLQA